MAYAEKYAPGKAFKFSELTIMKFSCSCHMDSQSFAELTFEMGMEFNSPEDLTVFMQGHIVADDGRVVGLPTSHVPQTVSGFPGLLMHEVAGRLYELPSVVHPHAYNNSLSDMFPSFCEHGCVKAATTPGLQEPEGNWPTKFQPFDMKVQA